MYVYSSGDSYLHNMLMLSYKFNIVKYSALGVFVKYVGIDGC